MTYLAMVSLVTANKTVSYKSVYIFSLNLNSVVFAWYLCILNGLVVISFKRVMEIIWEST